MKYQILQAYTAKKLEEAVSALLAEGFECVGPPALLYLPNAGPGENIVYVQAVVKGEE